MYAELDKKRVSAKKTAIGNVRCRTLMSIDVVSKLTMFTQLSTRTPTEQNIMWVIDSRIGNVKPQVENIYLFNRIVDPLNNSHSVIRIASIGTLFTIENIETSCGLIDSGRSKSMLYVDFKCIEIELFA